MTFTPTTARHAAGLLFLALAWPLAHAMDDGATDTPVRTLETMSALDGTTTLIRTRTFAGQPGEPARVQTETVTYAADGTPLERTHTELRINAEGVLVREHSRTVERPADGTWQSPGRTAQRGNGESIARPPAEDAGSNG